MLTLPLSLWESRAADVGGTLGEGLHWAGLVSVSVLTFAFLNWIHLV